MKIALEEERKSLERRRTESDADWVRKHEEETAKLQTEWESREKQFQIESERVKKEIESEKTLMEQRRTVIESELTAVQEKLLREKKVLAEANENKNKTLVLEDQQRQHLYEEEACCRRW